MEKGGLMISECGNNNNVNQLDKIGLLRLTLNFVKNNLIYIFLIIKLFDSRQLIIILRTNINKDVGKIVRTL